MADNETDGVILARLGTDGAKWAAEFTRVLDELGRATGPARERTIAGLATEPAPGELLHVWFVNALEAGRTAGQGNVSALASRIRAGLVDRGQLEALLEAVNDELARRDCADQGHPPYTNLDAGGRTVRAICHCGAQSWIPA